MYISSNETSTPVTLTTLGVTEVGVCEVGVCEEVDELDYIASTLSERNYYQNTNK